MAMTLRLASSGLTLSDRVVWAEGWDDRYPEMPLETIMGTTYLQRRGNVEWFNEVTFMFCDDLTNSTHGHRMRLKRAVRRLEWMIFTDKDGNSFYVRGRGRPEQEREPDSALKEIQYLTVVLLARGYES